MIDEFADEVAVVTGAASGIGLALSKRFAKAGMTVIMADVDPSRLDSAASEVANIGNVRTVPTDVSSADDVSNLADRAFEVAGSVAVLCNNAGVTTHGAGWEMSLDEWKWQIGVNLWGAIHGIRSFVPRMLEAGRPGHIVTTASMAGLLSVGARPYTVSKYGLVGLSEGLYNDLKNREAPIGVSVVCPGLVRTDLHKHSVSLSPGDREYAFRHSSASTAGQDPDELAEAVLQGIREDRFWIIPSVDAADEKHAGQRELLERRLAGILGTGEVVDGRSMA